MCEYKFIRINLRGFWSREPAEDHHAIVEEQARAGWRLVQIFAPAIYGYGRALFYELIFERPRR
jgi:hypothetical protein